MININFGDNKRNLLNTVIPLLIGFFISILTMFITQSLIERRENRIKQKELISELYGNIQLIRYYWNQYYELEATEKILAKECSINNSNYEDLRQVRTMAMNYLQYGYESRTKLLGVLKNVELYFPEDKVIDSIINSCNWLPIYYFSIYTNINNETICIPQDTTQQNKDLSDKITNYFAPLYRLVDICKEYINKSNNK